MRVRIEANVLRVERELEKFAAQVENVPGAPRELARAGQISARANVPSITGTLRRSISAHAGRNSSRVIVGRGLEYAAVIERGWREHNIEPDHYMLGALRVMRSRAPKTYADAIAYAARQRGFA